MGMCCAEWNGANTVHFFICQYSCSAPQWPKSCIKHQSAAACVGGQHHLVENMQCASSVFIKSVSLKR